MIEDSPEVREKMEGFMKQFDSMTQELKTVDEFMMLASSMMSYSKKMFESVIGEQGTRTLMIEMIPDVEDSRSGN